MSDIGQAMLAELRRIREALEKSQPLGFGKRTTPTYVFIKYYHEAGQTYVWYQRDRHEERNVPIPELDLTGYIQNVWRYDRIDETTGEHVPRLNIAVRADADYVLQTGFYTNFSTSFLAGILDLEPVALKVPLTLVVETNEGSRHRPTLFCRIEWRGKRLMPDLKNRDPKTLYQEVVERFSFHDPYEVKEGIHT
jgi:hypothetical protein